ncbi:RNA polymerase factor sigma-54 [Helicobacter kayseriensis]|uniref:RNA polymerase factor sigma-54 n=1 Tax=Helicobacter kayseriensis TaxID=2905877 RepID=UPI001E5983D0|nr:RNA polymerase factor sigma-54 [Helicobacter kayseriensis]MCE3046942.1 RNA polymerase factor sigma-54 [Helicobacter kayseriensis]MCE3048398.1 RNA polymerase factor sigma-54 [Helicobacter kayseriensis]
MKTGLRLNQSTKTKLSTTLKNWLPILQSSNEELEETLNEMIKDNPYAEVKNHSMQTFTHQNAQNKIPKKSKGAPEGFENFCFYEESLYQILQDQIAPPLFPTPLSQEIAQEIIENLNQEGYFEGDLEKIAQNHFCSSCEVEKIRKRFAYLEPYGIGALDCFESFHFQLQQSELNGDAYTLADEILQDLNNHFKYKNHPLYLQVMQTIKSFKNPPAIDFLAQEQYIKPDLFVYFDEGKIEVKLNDFASPSIEIDSSIQLMASKNIQEQFIKTKLKEARLLVDALEMRKATLQKIGLMIVEYQYDFFHGGEIKPMKLKDLADEFGHAPSTISRAISNKYLECDRGIFPIKSFFSTALDEDISNSAIKDFILDLIKNENRKKPLSDSKILELIEAKFGIKIVRRTITKYRQKLNIASSSERKKLYEMSL